MTVLVIAPHPDDEAIGCGGAVRLHADRGDRVVVAHLTSGELGLRDLPREQAWAIREAEALAAAEVLGVARSEFLRGRDYFLESDAEELAGRLTPILRQERPAVVFLPHASEEHPDHRAAAACYRLAAEAGGAPPPTVLAYEIWSPLARYNHLVDVSAVMPTKLATIRRYESQLTSFRYDDAIAGLNRYRGVMESGWEYAEAYENLTEHIPGGRVGLVPEA